MTITLETKQHLADLIAKPATVTQEDAPMLTALIKTYPFYQPLHLLLAKANLNTPNNSHLATAALYNGGGLLHKVVYQSESLVPQAINLVVSKSLIEPTEETQPVPQHQIAMEEVTHNLPNTTALDTDEQETYDEITEIDHAPKAEVEHQEETVDQTEESNPDHQTDNPTDEQETFDEITEITPATTSEVSLQEEETVDHADEFNHDLQADNPTDEQETFDEITEITPVPTTEVKPQEEETTETANIHENENPVTEERQLDDEDVFDEIAEIDNHTFSAPETTQNKEKLQSEKQLLSDEFAIESIVAMDFFAFEKSKQNNQVAEVKSTPQTNIPQPEEYNFEAEAQTISKYDDDKLPYTFLWWLAKTRKEHEQIFQPYVTAKRKNNSISGELQQQYIEHIFHLQTPFNTQEETNIGPLNRQISHKGNEIIETFIKNEPQIRVPKPDQINNENKAKKSAEDNYDLVSETLASIYIEQTLYHKAIDTYEKLSLKFPEKSRYFADLIQSLEKKI